MLKLQLERSHRVIWVLLSSPVLTVHSIDELSLLIQQKPSTYLFPMSPFWTIYESDVVQTWPCLLAYSSYYWFSDDNTSTTIQHCVNSWWWKRENIQPWVVRKVWCEQSNILRRLTLNCLGLISVPVPKSLLNPFNTAKPCLCGNADS